MTPSRTRFASRHRTPTTIGRELAKATRSSTVLAASSTSDEARTVEAAVSGPTTSWRDDPKSA
jgi:hypothetical protein